VVLVAGAVLWLLWPRAVLVEAATIDRGEVVREIGEEGRVRIRDVFTVTAPIAGQLDRIELQPGDHISKGDVVAMIRPVVPALLDARTEREAKAVVAAARSALALAQADARLAAVEQERVTQLFERGFAAKAALDRSQTGLDVANAVVRQREADLKRAEATIARPSSQAKAIAVRSPSTGRVLQVLQESETVLLPGSPLLEIGDPASLEIVAEYLSQDAALIEEGACAVVESAGIAPIPARVKTVEPYARTKVSALGVEEQRVKIILNLEEAQAGDARLGHGYRMDVRIVMFRQEDALRVPTDALVRGSQGEWTVFRIVSDRARLTPIEVGDGDDRFRTVQSGLAPGDLVVLFPGETLKDGDLVRQAK
jgi:HlyD family secretion protein